MKNDEKYAINDEYTERHKINERMENVMKQTIYEQLGGTVQMMNNVRSQAEEIVIKELVLCH